MLLHCLFWFSRCILNYANPIIGSENRTVLIMLLHSTWHKSIIMRIAAMNYESNLKSVPFLCAECMSYTLNTTDNNEQSNKQCTTKDVPKGFYT